MPSGNWRNLREERQDLLITGPLTVVHNQIYLVLVRAHSNLLKVVVESAAAYTPNRSCA
jgi:hypothetical protein